MPFFLSIFWTLVAMVAVQTASASAPPSGLYIDKYAIGLWTRTIVYDWRVNVLVPEKLPQPVIVPQGESVVIPVSFVAERDVPVASETLSTPQQKVIDEIGSRGNICVTNFGSAPARRLKIVDQLETPSPQNPDVWLPIEEALTEIRPKGTLHPGETRCFPYSNTFKAMTNVGLQEEPQLLLRNRANVSALQFETAQITRVFPLPLQPFITNYIDESATAELGLSGCPSGVDGCTGMAGTFAAGEFTLNFNVRNNSVPCESQFDLTAYIELVESDTGQTRNASVVIPVSTGACTP